MQLVGVPMTGGEALKLVMLLSVGCGIIGELYIWTNRWYVRVCGRVSHGV